MKNLFKDNLPVIVWLVVVVFWILAIAAGGGKASPAWTPECFGTLKEMVSAINVGI